MIKKILFGALFLSSIVACNNQTTTQNATTDSTSNVGTADSMKNEALGKIEYIDSVYNFGTVKEGVVVEHVFKFKNTGEAPVILIQVSASCGCTTPSYTQEPILPGKEGEIKVSFDSKGQLGNQHKVVSVYANASNKATSVQLRGTVEK